MAKRRSEKSARFIRGSTGLPRAIALPRCRCRNTNQVNAASALASNSAACSDRPSCSCTRPFSRHKVPVLANSRPGQSRAAALRRAAAPPGAPVGTKRIDIHNATRQNGTTMKKIERQPNHSTSKPPRLGPRAGASTAPSPKMLMARGCSCGSKARMMMMAGIGCTTPAARPSATRAASTSGKTLASPPPIPPASNTHMAPA